MELGRIRELLRMTSVRAFDVNVIVSASDVVVGTLDGEEIRNAIAGKAVRDISIEDIIRVRDEVYCLGPTSFCRLFPLFVDAIVGDYAQPDTLVTEVIARLRPSGGTSAEWFYKLTETLSAHQRHVVALFILFVATSYQEEDAALLLVEYWAKWLCGDEC